MARRKSIFYCFQNDYLIESGEWEMLNITQERYEKYYPCCLDAPYVSVEYGVHVRRRGGGSLRSALMRTPAAVSALMALMSHCLPPSSPRLPLAAAPPTLLSIALLYLGHRLPASMYTPNIGKKGFIYIPYYVNFER